MVPQVAIIIVHWLNMEDTIECLASLDAVNYPSLEIIIVSTGSPDFDEQQIHRQFPAATVLVLQENLGFAGANNVGIGHAMRTGAEYVLLLNPDTTVEPSLIAGLLPAFAGANVGIVGPVIRYYDRPEQIWFAGGRYSRWFGYSLHPGMGEPIASAGNDRDVDFINGCALMVSRATIERIGPLSEQFFMYFEDFEYCLRAKAAGLRCYLVAQPLVRHKVSSSAGQRGSNAMTPGKAYYFGRNPFLVLRHTIHGFWAVTGLVSQFLVVLPYHTLQAIRAGNLAAMRLYLVGMWDGMQGRSGVRRTEPQRFRSAQQANERSGA